MNPLLPNPPPDSAPTAPDEPRADSEANARARVRAALPALPDLTPGALRALAEECETQGMVADGVTVCRRLLEVDPRDAATWSRLADLHSERGDRDRAGRCRTRAAELSGVAAGLESDEGPG